MYKPPNKFAGGMFIRLPCGQMIIFVVIFDISSRMHSEKSSYLTLSIPVASTEKEELSLIHYCSDKKGLLQISVWELVSLPNNGIFACIHLLIVMLH